MYSRITAGRLQLLDNNGLPAVNFEIYTYLAGGTTAAVSYLNRDCAAGHENTNPIILDARGECKFYTNRALKMVYVTPGGDPTSPIWEEDYLGEQQGVPPLPATITAGTTNNNYVGTITPIATSLSDQQMVVFTPDTDSLTTLTSHTFSGTGIDDLQWSGPYVGTTPGSVFQTQIDSCSVDAPTAPTAVLSGTAGSVTVGNHYVKITFYTAGGETLPGIASAVVAASGSKKIDLSAIPLGTAGKGIVGRKIYMTEAAGTDYFLVDTIADVITATYAIDITDAALAASTAAPSTNTTGDSAGADTFKWRKDSGSWIAGVAITALAQTLIEGVKVTFPIKNGHTLNDLWALTVMTPARFNFCALGNYIIYKNVAGTLKALDAADLKQDIPALVIYSLSQTCWILQAPGLPVLTEIQPSFIIKEIVGNYPVVAGNAREFLNCSNAGTITLESCNEFVNKDIWIKSKDGSDITVVVAGGTDKIYKIFDPVGVTSLVVGPGGWDCARFASNGAYYVVVEAITVLRGYALYTHADDGTYWTCPDGITRAKVSIVAPGGGGAGTSQVGNHGGAGGAGGYSSQWVTTVPGTTYLITLPDGGAAGPADGSTNGVSGGSFFRRITLCPWRRWW